MQRIVNETIRFGADYAYDYTMAQIRSIPVLGRPAARTIARQIPGGRRGFTQFVVDTSISPLRALMPLFSRGLDRKPSSEFWDTVPGDDNDPFDDMKYRKKARRSQTKKPPPQMAYTKFGKPAYRKNKRRVKSSSKKTMRRIARQEAERVALNQDVTSYITQQNAVAPASRTLITAASTRMILIEDKAVRDSIKNDDYGNRSGNSLTIKSAQLRMRFNGDAAKQFNCFRVIVAWIKQDVSGATVSLDKILNDITTKGDAFLFTSFRELVGFVRVA